MLDARVALVFDTFVYKLLPAHTCCSIPTKEILLLDDDPNNARDTDGQFHTFHVNENIGFDIQDFLARFE